MSKLKYMSDAVWERLPVDDFRPRFFIDAYTEKLRMNTPHFYQSRLLNIFGACSEMVEHIEIYQRSEKNGAYIASSIDELVECWDADPIAQEIFGELATLRQELVRTAKSSEFDSNALSRLKSLCRAMLCRREHYVVALLEQLENSVVGAADLTQKDRVTSLIDRLTGLYTTFLLDQGYSPTYLYNRTEMFLRERNYGGRTFAEQFHHITSRLRSQQFNFEVYYGFRASRPSALLSVEDEPDLELLNSIPNDITGSELVKFTKNIEINVVAKSTLTATDYVTASLKAKERIDRFLDTATALEFGNDIQVSASCVAITRGVITHRKALNVDLLLAFMSSESGTAISQSITPIRHAFKSLDDTAKEQLGRSLRYLRMAKNSFSIEQKLLNLWIALESLFTNVGKTVLGNILDFVPQFYAVTGVARRVAYLRDLLVANEVEVTPQISSSICPGLAIFDASVTDEQIFFLLRNKAAAIELFNSLASREHLKFKLMRIFEELENNKAVTNRLARSQADVTRQLRRIYFLRNKIAHTGHFHGVRPQLATHLLDYVVISYRAIAAAAEKAREGHVYSISELLASARMGADLVSARALSKDEVTSIDQVTLHAVI